MLLDRGYIYYFRILMLNRVISTILFHDQYCYISHCLSGMLVTFGKINEIANHGNCVLEYWSPILSDPVLETSIEGYKIMVTLH